jgi:hypothetical protein
MLNELAKKKMIKFSTVLKFLKREIYWKFYSVVSFFINENLIKTKNIKNNKIN